MTCPHTFCRLRASHNYGYKYLLWVPIGSLRCLCLLWLVRATTLVWVLRHPVENRSMNASLIQSGGNRLGVVGWRVQYLYACRVVENVSWFNKLKYSVTQYTRGSVGHRMICSGSRAFCLVCFSVFVTIFQEFIGISPIFIYHYQFIQTTDQRRPKRCTYPVNNNSYRLYIGLEAEVRDYMSTSFVCKHIQTSCKCMGFICSKSV